MKPTKIARLRLDEKHANGIFCDKTATLTVTRDAIIKNKIFFLNLIG